MLENYSGGGGVLVVRADSNGVLNKTWRQIHDAPLAVFQDPYDPLYVGFELFTLNAINANGIYLVKFGESTFFADNEDEYPSSS